MGFSKKKAMIILTAILVLAFFIFPSFFLGLFFRDIAPIEDSDLRFEKVDVPNEQNAYYDFMSFGEGDAVKYPEGNIGLDECLSDEKCLKEAGEANEINFAVIDRILAKQYFVNPDFADPSEVSTFDTVYNDRNILYVAALQPYYLLQKGENEKAIEASFKIFEVSQKIKSGRPGRVDFLVAVALDGLGAKAVRDVMGGSDFSSDDLLRYSEMIGRLEDNDGQAIALAFGKAYYFEMADLADKLSSGEITTSGFLAAYSAGMGGDPGAGPEMGSSADKIFTDKFYFQPNKTKKLFAEDARKVVAASQASCDSALLSDYAAGKASGSLNLQPVARFYPNYGGSAVYDMVVSDKSGVRIVSCRARSQMVMTRLLLALKAYNQDNGRLPDSLETLVPNYLPEVPKDPFSGQDLKYSLEKKIIYSVGQNGTERDLNDDGGDEEKDIVVRIDF